MSDKVMRIHAKSNGLMSVVQVYREEDEFTEVKAIDEVRKKKIYLNDPNNKLFLDVEAAMVWISKRHEEVLKAQRANRNSRKV